MEKPVYRCDQQALNLLLPLNSLVYYNLIK